LGTGPKAAAAGRWLHVRIAERKSESERGIGTGRSVAYEA
jgi:hypothetical protein